MNVIVDVPPEVIGLVPNAFAIVGCPYTNRLAVFETVPGVGTSVVVTPLVLFGFVPSVLEVTTTVTVQLPLAGMVMPLKLRLVAPAVKLLELAPVQVPPAFPVALIDMLTSVSVKDAFVI